MTLATIMNPESVTAVDHPMPDSYEGNVTYPVGSVIRLRDCFGEAFALAAGAQALHAELPAKTNIRAHFHDADQWQIYDAHAGGWYQRTDFSGVIVHYTDAYALYGPFGTSEPDGSMTVFSLRAQATELAGWLPEDRDKMIRRGKRNYLFPYPEVDRSETNWFQLFGPEKDGLAGYCGFIAQSERLTAPEIPSVSAGRFFCIMSGSLWLGEKEFKPEALMWQEFGEDIPQLVADESSGCEIVLMQFPQAIDAPQTQGSHE